MTRISSLAQGIQNCNKPDDYAGLYGGNNGAGFYRRTELTADPNNPGDDRMVFLFKISNLPNGLYRLKIRAGQGGAGCPYIYGETYHYFKISSATPTPPATPTPTQGPWIKLKNSSFQSNQSLSELIPSNPIPFDGDAPGHAYFIDNDANGEAGVISVQQISPPTDPQKLSLKGWYITNYSPAFLFNRSDFLTYAQSRKETKLISSLNQLEDKKINIYTGDLTIDNVSSFNNKKAILVVKEDDTGAGGTVSFSLSDFTPSQSAIAVIAKEIDFYSGNTYVTTAHGIFLAETIKTGESQQGLKIKGNLITSTFDNGRTQQDNRQPSVFIVFDPSFYLNLLPYLSVAKYDWRQLQ
ncbi:MAG: hypothetical protein ABIK18_05035 [candidate division WOR-3 bacterium]